MKTKFNEKIPIEYTPKDFYDELVQAQQIFQSDESFNYIETNLLTQLEKDNLDFINNFQEIKKFRQYYTEQLVYEYMQRNKLIRITANKELRNISEEWFKPFEITKGKKMTTFFDNLLKRIKNNSNNNKHGISSILLSIKTTDPLINDILSYSTIPALFSYFLTDKANCVYVDELKYLVSEYTKSNDHIYYDYIKIYLKGVFKMPMFINFLNKVIYSILTPYLNNEKPFSKDEVSTIYFKILEKVNQYKSRCPQIMKNIISVLLPSENNEKNNKNSLCISIFKDCLFYPLQKEPAIFMCSDFPPYEMNPLFLKGQNRGEKVDSIIEKRTYRYFFNAIFPRKYKDEEGEIYDKADKFFFDFITKISKDNKNEASVDDEKSIEMNMTMNYNYFFNFDVGLIESEIINYENVVQNFKDSVEQNSFSLLFNDNVITFDDDNHADYIKSSLFPIESQFNHELLQLIKTAPILKKRLTISQDKILDIISEYLINKNDPLKVGIDVYRFTIISEIWNKDDSNIKFPKNKNDLIKYFNNIMSKRDQESNVESIKQQSKEKGIFELKLRLSEKAFKNWKYYINSIVIKDLILKVFVNPKDSECLFPRTKNIIEDPSHYFYHMIRIILNNLYDFNDKKLKLKNLNDSNDNKLILKNLKTSIPEISYYKKEFEDFNIKDFLLTLTGFFLNCNLKYYNYIFLKPNLNDCDSVFHESISSNIDKIVVLIKNKIPYVYKNTFGSSTTYFTVDVIRMRNAFNANVDPHKKIYLIQYCINHSISKIDSQFTKDEEEVKFFIDLLITFANPSNLLSNVAFMIEYQVRQNYLDSISSYFNHFIEFIWSANKLFKNSEKELELYNNEDLKKLLICDQSDKSANEKKTVIISYSDLKVSLLMQKLVPHPNLDWSNLDNEKQVEFDVKQKNVYVHCVFTVDKSEKFDFNGFDVVVVFFDFTKQPKNIVTTFSQIKNVAKIAVCNTNRVKNANLKNYKNAFDPVFDFSNDKLTKI